MDILIVVFMYDEDLGRSGVYDSSNAIGFKSKINAALWNENRTRNQETTRRTVNVEYTSSKAIVAIDGAGFDWSYMADDETLTNMAFMAFSDSE
nr:hypothetical protein [Tanacetum cinerariifolium]